MLNGSVTYPYYRSWNVEFQTHPVPANFKDAHINAEKYQAMYKRSIEDPEGFFGEMASEFLSWDQPWDSVVNYDFVKGEAAWFSGGKLNVSYNCIDRHLPERADQTALIWEGMIPPTASTSPMAS